MLTFFRFNKHWVMENKMLKLLLVRYCLSIRFVVRAVGRSVTLLMPLLAGIVAYEVFARYFLDAPTIWAYDTSLFLFGYISALGGAYAQQKQAHINVDILYLHVSERVQHLFSVVTIILAMGFLLVMAKVSLEKFFEVWEYGYRRQSEWAPSVHHFWLMITVSSVLFIAEYSVQLICHLYALFTQKALIPDAYRTTPAAEQQPDNADTKKANQAGETLDISVGGSHGN